MPRVPWSLIPLFALTLLAACAREVRAEVPKPLPGGHAFELEVAEVDGAGQRSTQRYVVTVGETGCGRLQASAGNQSVSVQTCLIRASDAKPTVDVELVRVTAGDRTKIEGRVPFVAGQKAVVGRAESGGRKLEVSVTAA